MHKLYKSGQDFLADNNGILADFPLETVFFELNAKRIENTDKNDFLIKLQCGNGYLLAVHCSSKPLVLFGDVALCAEFARVAFEEKLTFNKVLGAKETCEIFLSEYRRFTGARFEINRAMDIMQCRQTETDDVCGVERATEKDLNEIAELAALFENEAFGESDVKDYKQKLQGIIRDFAFIRRDGKIVSLAAKVRENQSLCAISWVYTLPRYRNNGLSRRVVTHLTKSVLNDGKLPYLFVDKNNPISNHLYTKIGYTYAAPQYEYKLIGIEA
ncbi:MAG: GNAT family N-acetyltransferase [Corallococcus sp.]|nr:GNAT family N-acetyltransferase [Bacillota bacterium]MCM1533850.1 GNAT family N-acetyltransferase [Corallococcus sp.]